jgi:hypothetical protein
VRHAEVAVGGTARVAHSRDEHVARAGTGERDLHRTTWVVDQLVWRIDHPDNKVDQSLFVEPTLVAGNSVAMVTSERADTVGTDLRSIRSGDFSCSASSIRPRRLRPIG